MRVSQGDWQDSLFCCEQVRLAAALEGCWVGQPLVEQPVPWAAERRQLAVLFSLLETLPTAARLVISSANSDQDWSVPDVLDLFGRAMYLATTGFLRGQLGVHVGIVRKTPFAYDESSENLSSDAPECRTAAKFTSKKALYAHGKLSGGADVFALPPESILEHESRAGWNFQSSPESCRMHRMAYYWRYLFSSKNPVTLFGCSTHPRQINTLIVPRHVL